MNAIPNEQLNIIKSKPSPLYKGLLNGSNRLTLQDVMKPELDLKRALEENPIGSCKLPYRIYEPLVFSINENEPQSIAGCVWNCIGKQYGIVELTAGILAAKSGMIKKDKISKDVMEKVFVMGKQTKSKASSYASYFSILEQKNPKLKINMGTHLPAYTLMRKRPFIKKISTDTLLAFYGRWIPWFGWGLLALDILQISLCTKSCIENYNKDHKDILA